MVTTTAQRLGPKRINVIHYQMKQSGMHEISQNPIYHQHTKCIDIQYHYMREKFLERAITLRYCPMDTTAADASTKAFGKTKHIRHITDLLSEC
jgi:hypothetical protein